jgi:hypothetical protein
VQTLCSNNQTTRVESFDFWFGRFLLMFWGKCLINFHLTINDNIDTIFSGQVKRSVYIEWSQLV